MKNCMFILLMLSLASQAQVMEDFSDGELLQNPSWYGELEKFKISSSSAIPAEMRPALQLNSEGAGNAFISLQQGYSPDMQWEFWIKLSFNTSSSNFSRLYLSSNYENPVEADRAFFIQVGCSEDSVWFGKTDSTGTIRLFTLPVLYTGNSTNALRIKVICKKEGVWKFFGEPSGGASLSHLGDVHVADSLGSGYFSLYCQFTSSNATKCYFDDLYCGPEIVDSVAPALVEIKNVSPSEVLLAFNEAIGENSASDVSHYHLSDNIGHPYEAFRMLDLSCVMLFFEEEMEEGSIYHLAVNGIMDISGNLMDDTVADLSWYKSRPYDIIINEILADPSPAVMLPEYEYIELFNRTGHTLDLEGWCLDVSGNKHDIIAGQISPDGYLLLMKEEALAEFQFCGPAIGFPSFSISNAGADIALLDEEEKVICHTFYRPDKYPDAEKAQGGWSLERTDPWFPCMDESSWQGSSDPSGGTPGSENSKLIPSTEEPSVNSICCVNDSCLVIRFNLSLSPGSLTDPGFYDADHGLGQPASGETAGEAANEALLCFPGPAAYGQQYRLTVSPELLDCTGNPIGMELSGIFALPSLCGPFDILFNEILFQPLSDGAEYIELFNRSGKTIHLDELILAYIREVPPNPPDTERYQISESCLPLLPGGYAVLTKYPEKVMVQYFVESTSTMHKMSSFPLLNNEGGKLLLLNLSGNTIDALEYSEGMHYPLLGSFAGVSLERICADIQCTGPENWHSASSACGFGTPGYINSQHLENPEPEDVLDAMPCVFSPDGDGRDDVMVITCSFDEPGMLVSILIFSEDGRMARRLVDTALAGAENTFFWDGLTDQHYPAAAGVYIILMECVSMDGYSRKYKKVVVLI